MKTIAPVLLTLVLSGLASHAQSAKPAASDKPVLMQSAQTVKKPEKEEKKPAIIVPKQTNSILGQPVIYGGYFTDFVRAENKRALFDLKTPADPKKGMENLWFYPGTETIRGTVLFSIKF
jgi:hypothetical protein